VGIPWDAPERFFVSLPGFSASCFSAVLSSGATWTRERIDGTATVEDADAIYR